MNTKTPEPVSSETTEIKLALDGVVKKVATPVPKPDTPVAIGKPVALVKVADVGVPRMPTEVTAPVRLAFVVTFPAVKPAAVPVMFVPTSALGVPRAGVTSVGLVANTNDPEPVSSVTAVAKLADDGVAKKVATPVPRPLTPVLIGKPVALVKVADVGVPKTGVTNVGDVSKANTVPVPVVV